MSVSIYQIYAYLCVSCVYTSDMCMFVFVSVSCVYICQIYVCVVVCVCVCVLCLYVGYMYVVVCLCLCLCLCLVSIFHIKMHNYWSGIQKEMFTFYTETEEFLLILCS